MNRFRKAISGEEGASTLELIIFAAVILVLAGFFFAFRNKAAEFIQSATGKVGDMQNVMENRFDAGESDLPLIP